MEKFLSTCPPCSQKSTSSAARSSITHPTILSMIKLMALPLSEPSPSILIIAAPLVVSAVAANAPSIQAVTAVPSGAGSPSMLTSSLDMWGGTGGTLA